MLGVAVEIPMLNGVSYLIQMRLIDAHSITLFGPHGRLSLPVRRTR